MPYTLEGSGLDGGVEARLAVAYRRYSADYVAEEEAARKARTGIWAGQFTWPERWRRENR